MTGLAMVEQPPVAAADRLHVLHVLDHSIPLHSGYAFRTLAILKQQRARGWDTSQLTGPKQGGAEYALEQVDGWDFFRTPLRPGRVWALAGLREWALIGALERRLEAVARARRPSLLHAHSPALNAVAALRVGRRLGIPVVYEVRAFWEDAAVDLGTSRAGGPRYRLTRALETWALRRVDAVTTICDGLRRDLIARGIPAERITVIPNAVDVERFRSGGEVDPGLRTELGLDGARVLGFVGSFYAYEGLATLLHALPQICAGAPDVRVLLVGGGPQAEQLQRLAVELGIADGVCFTGRVPHGEVGRYYDLIDILVYPRDSMRLTELVTPLKPLEAMAQGRLLVASDVGGHRELIRDRETGLLFRAGDSQDLATTVLGLLTSEGAWPGLRARARRFVERERNWTLSVAGYATAYARAGLPGLVEEGDLAPAAPGTDTAGTGGAGAPPSAAQVCGPRIAVLSTLFPRPSQPTAGIFIRERMSHVARHLPVTVIAPVPWIPGEGIIRRWRPHFRPVAPREQSQQGLHVLHPRFLSLPGVLRSLDGFAMALGSLAALRRLQRHSGVDLIDAHFGYPDGVAAAHLARWLRLPFTVTLRGTEPRLGRTRIRGALMRRALRRATWVIAVSSSLRDWAQAAGVAPGRICVVGNGVDGGRFAPIDARTARRELGLTESAPVLVSVGGLTERKGFHRVIACLPVLLRRWPGLRYLIIGGASGEGDWGARLRSQVEEAGLDDCVSFLGVIAPERLQRPLSAADVFVLATRNEGWANVLLEAMACGLPVVTTDVGGNREVVSHDGLGTLVPFGDEQALTAAIDAALVRDWDRAAIRAWAEANGWENRMATLIPLLRALDGRAPVIASDSPKEVAP